jgi:hypothetical protein
MQGDCAALALVMVRVNRDWTKLTPSEFLTRARVNVDRAKNECDFTPLELEEIALAVVSANRALEGLS